MITDKSAGRSSYIKEFHPLQKDLLLYKSHYCLVGKSII